MTGSNTDYGFIELHRTFHELTSNSVESDDVDFTWIPGLSRSQSWPDLIKEYRLIILSEAGSGKTSEIRHIARTLRAQNKQAFFLRLEHVTKNFNIAFAVGTHGNFEKWLLSEEIGWIFLDSVDEARLRDPGDFELAILELSNRIQAAFGRVHMLSPVEFQHGDPKPILTFVLPTFLMMTPHYMMNHKKETVRCRMIILR